MDKVYIGIDPGLGGAVTIINDGTPSIFDVPTFKKATGKEDYDMPSMARLLRPYFMLPGKLVVAVIEDVHAMPGQGGVSMFNFGRGKGIWEGICAAFGFEVHMVSPQTWKKDYPELLIHKDKPQKTLKKNTKLTKAEKEAEKAMAKELAREKRLAKAASKAKARGKAGELYPSLASQFEKVNSDGRAESLLIARYGMSHF